MSKTKIQMEYDMKHISVQMLWEFISTAPGLAKWFADDVSVDGKQYTFFWHRSPRRARLTALRADSHIRLRWDDEDPRDRSYFEMRILTSGITSGVTLQVTDFADEGEEESIRELWSTEISDLRRAIGC